MSKLPNINDEAGWGQWTLQQLELIANANQGAFFRNMSGLSGVAGNESARKRKNHAFEQTLTQLKAVFPEQSWTGPNGKQLSGHQLPQSILDASYLPNDKTSMRGNLLNMCLTLDMDTMAPLKWLMASGFKVDRFNPHTENTAIGRSAYMGDYRTLKMFRSFGIPMDLTLRPEHLDDPVAHANLVGTTLLHRLVARAGKMGAKAVPTVKELLLSGLDPLTENAGGQTALSLARGEVREALEQWVSEHEQRALEKATASPKPTSRRKTPRL